MAYGYWKSGKKADKSVFEIFFRKNPFQGEFTIFAGLTDCIEYFQEFKFSDGVQHPAYNDGAHSSVLHLLPLFASYPLPNRLFSNHFTQLLMSDIAYLKQAMPPSTDPGFFDYLATLDTSEFELWAMEEGSTVFPREPIVRVEGPVIICQLLETTLLNLVNFASLITTNAARFRLSAGPGQQLFEFGLRRAQGPDGGLSASRYAYMGGYDGTSNVLAGKLYQIPVVGTHAHSFVSAFQEETIKPSICDKASAHSVTMGDDENPSASDDVLQSIPAETMQLDPFLKRAYHWSQQLGSVLRFSPNQVNQGELVAFASYAIAFPDTFVGLIDTYDVLRSGLPNFCAISLALHEFGYRARGIRIDSGDLAFLSCAVRKRFGRVADHYNLPWFKELRILVSNDLNEDTLHSLNQQSHSIDVFCVGTNLVTCQKQPALGCVYKLVEINGNPTMKLSAVVDKVTLPGRKNVYRLYSKCDEALLDLLQRYDEPAPQVGERILCRHPSDASKRAYVTPSRVEATLKLFWKNGKLVHPLPTLEECRTRIQKEMIALRSDYKRLLNPTPYKVSLSDKLYLFTQELWSRMAPIAEIS